MNYQAEIRTLCSLCKIDKTYVDDFVRHGIFNKKDFINLIQAFVGKDGAIYFEHGYTYSILFDNTIFNVISFNYDEITCVAKHDKTKIVKYKYNKLSFVILIRLFKTLFYYYHFCINR